MQIIIKCDCGNDVIIAAPSGKYTQFRDCISKQSFYFGNVEIKGNKTTEFIIQCSACQKWIKLGVD